MQRIKRVKKILGWTFGISFFILYGIVGGIEYGSVSLLVGGVICAVCLLAMWTSAKINTWLERVVDEIPNGSQNRLDEYGHIYHITKTRQTLNNLTVRKSLEYMDSFSSISHW